MCSRRFGRRVIEGADFLARKLPETPPEHSVHPGFFFSVSIFNAFITSGRYCQQESEGMEYSEIGSDIFEIRRPGHSA